MALSSRAFQSRRAERADSPRSPQRRASAKQMPFFVAKHYNLDISNFRFAILRSCPTALLGRAAFAAYERFAGGKTSAEGWLCHPEHLNHRRAERALGPRSPKRKTRYKRVFLFGAAGGNRTHNLLITNEELFVLPSFVHFRKPLRRKACGVFIVCLVSPRNAHYGQNKPQINPQTNGKNAPHLNTVQ